MSQATENMRFYHEKIWSYFEMHAKQRMYTFYLYIFADGFLFKTLIEIPNDGFDRWLLVAIIVIFTLAFYCLDRRNLFMINKARDMLKNYESDTLISEYQLFNIVFTQTKVEEENYRWFNIFKYPYRFEYCFNTIFFSSIMIAILLAAI